MPIKVNPRALEAATIKVWEGERLGRRPWLSLTDEERRDVQAVQADFLRAYDEAKQADLISRRQEPGREEPLPAGAGAHPALRSNPEAQGALL